jgi:hypothetical protein
LFVAMAAVPGLANPLAFMATGPLCLISLVVLYVWTKRQVTRPVARLGQPVTHGLPAGVTARLDELYQVVSQIGERRHREALRAVVHRVIALSRDTPSIMEPEIEAEMEHAIHLAAGATLRMDQLDREMGRPGFDPAEASARAVMHERDLWSARLLDLTATLDALTVRRVAARLATTETEPTEALQALRATVEALEEVQRV